MSLSYSEYYVSQLLLAASHNEVSTELFLLPSIGVFIATSPDTFIRWASRNALQLSASHLTDHRFLRHHSLLLVSALHPKPPGTQSVTCYIRWWSSCWSPLSIDWDIRTRKTQSDTFFSIVNGKHLCYYRTSFCDFWRSCQSSSFLNIT